MGLACQLKANEAYKKLGRPLPYPHLDNSEEIEEVEVEEAKVEHRGRPKKSSKEA